MRHKALRNTLVMILLFMLLICFILPILITFINSFMDSREIGEFTRALDKSSRSGWVPFKLIPDKVTVYQYFTILLREYKYLHMFLNSCKYAVTITAGQLIVSTMAAFVFSKMQFKFRNALFIIYIIAMMLPFQVTMVPNYITLKTLNLINTDYSIILPGIFAPFGVFLLRQFMMTIPDRILEAASIDGADIKQIFVKFILPLSIPGIISVLVLTFIENWNLVEQPLIFLDDISKYPLSISLNSIIESSKDVAFAGSFVYLLPMIILYFNFQEYFISGIRIGQLQSRRHIDEKA